MPTARPRHVITETDDIARALDDAARRWPEETSRARLLVRLLEEGHRAVSAAGTRHRADRLKAIAETSGALTGCYGNDYLTELRQDWPA